MKIEKKLKQFIFLLAQKKLSLSKPQLLLSFSAVLSLLILTSSLTYSFSKDKNQEVLGSSVSEIERKTVQSLQNTIITITIEPSNTPIPTQIPTPTQTPTPKPMKIITQTPTAITPTFNPTASDNSQYTAKQINNVTWQVSNVQNDSQMSSPQDIFNSLNSYRNSHGVGSLLWDNGLATFAQNRAQTFSSSGGLDGHAGFTNFMNNNGFSKIGFNSLGENSAYLSGPMSGDKIIKEIFGADQAHDSNQLNPSWSYVGIGVVGNAINVNFGGGKR